MGNEKLDQKHPRSLSFPTSSTAKISENVFIKTNTLAFYQSDAKQERSNTGRRSHTSSCPSEWKVATRRDRTCAKLVASVRRQRLNQACTTSAFLVARESFFNCRKCCKPDFGYCRHRIFTRLLHNEIDFCGPRKIFFDQFGPSSFLSCAGLAWRKKVRSPNVCKF